MSKKLVVVLLLIIITNLHAAASLHAVDSLYLWADRKDRFEGVVTAENVSQTSIDLIGVHAIVAKYQTGENPRVGALRLSFMASAPLKLKVKVWDPQSNYIMKPKQVLFSPASPFTWPRSAVLSPLQIPTDHLRLLASDTNDNYVPGVILDGTSIPIVYSGYNFFLESHTGFDLQGGVFREERGLLTKISSLSAIQKYGGVCSVKWTWPDRSQSTPSPGVYHLKLSGTAFFPTHDEDVNLDIPFVHYGT